MTETSRVVCCCYFTTAKALEGNNAVSYLLPQFPQGHARASNSQGYSFLGLFVRSYARIHSMISKHPQTWGVVNRQSLRTIIC